MTFLLLTRTLRYAVTLSFDPVWSRSASHAIKLGVNCEIEQFLVDRS